MLHLLPEHQKNMIIAEYHKRLGIMACLFVIVTAMAGFVLLLPSYIAAHGRLAEVEEKRNEVEKRLAQISTNTNGDAVKDVSDKIVALAPLGADTNASTVFDQFLSIVIPGIQISHLGYAEKVDKTITLNVDGTSLNRDALVAFADILNKSGKFSGAHVPLSSLRTDKNIGFSFKLLCICGASKTNG
ncbi:MAG: hypothetical protein V4664_03950, partial [Patescibacteria group bacterium]